MAKIHNLKASDRVRLLSKPDGQTSRTLPLTVGSIYIFYHYDGSNVCTSTDDPNQDGYYNRERVKKVTD